MEKSTGCDIVENLFDRRFTKSYEKNMRDKLGLTTTSTDDKQLFEQLFETMSATNADFTETFLNLEDYAANDSSLIQVLDGLVDACANPKVVEVRAG